MSEIDFFELHSFEELYLKIMDFKFDIPRFRSIELTLDMVELDDTHTKIIPSMFIRTKTGGDNRNNYKYENAAMRKTELYLYDEDAVIVGDDGTYAYFYYKIPKKYKELARIVYEYKYNSNKDWQYRHSYSQFLKDNVNYLYDLLNKEA